MCIQVFDISCLKYHGLRDVIETFRQFWRQEEGFLKEVKTCFLGKEERANQFLSPIHT